MVIYAPAKVNLYLKVLGKRPDGYHNIETVFERISLSDRIVLCPLKNNSIKIVCDNPDVPKGKESLIYRTISLLKKECKVTRGVEAKIFKKIPIASGLGGGSSDAASVLIGLNKLWKLFLNFSDLLKLGKKLGADIPFFLEKVPFAIATERGDRILPLSWKVKFWHLLVSPPVRLLSRDIYKKIGTDTIFHWGKTAKNGVCPYFFTYFSNDLEQTILKKVPLVAKLKRALKNIGLSHSLVSGSGPSVFSLFKKRKEAMRARELLIKRFPIVKDKGWRIFVVSTL